MVISVKTNADMPVCLNTESTQAKKVKQLAQSHSGIPAKRAEGPKSRAASAELCWAGYVTGQQGGCHSIPA